MIKTGESSNAESSNAVVLEVSGVKYRYAGQRGSTPAGHERFDLVAPDLRVRRGERVLIAGPSGVGKSTLLMLIAGLDTPSRGTIGVAGTRIHGLSGSTRDLFRATHIGMIFQTFNLLQGFSALENVLAALMFSKVPRGKHRARALALLKHLGIEKPNAKVEDLSVGQRQRVAVARAVACEPALVLADEPTASLDDANAQGAMDMIFEACASTRAALVCVSHDRSIAPRFDTVIEMVGPAGGPAGSSAGGLAKVAGAVPGGATMEGAR